MTNSTFDNDRKYNYPAFVFIWESKRRRCGTFILSTESVVALAWWMRWVCSMYSVNRWRKLRGSLNITGMAIFDNSWKRCWRRSKMLWVKWNHSKNSFNIQLKHLRFSCKALGSEKKHMNALFTLYAYPMFCLSTKLHMHESLSTFNLKINHYQTSLNVIQSRQGLSEGILRTPRHWFLCD